MNEKIIMEEEEVERAISRIAMEILEKNNGTDDLAIVGIQRRGVMLAQKIVQKIEELEQVKLPFGILDITFYRDDFALLGEHPVVNSTDIPFPVYNKKIVLADDVLYTGRTIRCAIDALMEMGRADAIYLAVLADRGGRELPIAADFVGKYVPASKSERIDVNVPELDGRSCVVISKKGEAE